LSTRNFIKYLARKVTKNLENINEENISKLIDFLLHADRIFTVGRGRSALVSELFAIRLLQLGFNVSAIGERILDLAPPIGGKKDIVIAVSGSGETEEVITYCNAAKRRGALIVGITSFEDSPLSNIADLVIIVKGRTRKWHYKMFLEREIEGEREPITHEGSLFEISTIFLFEAIIDELYKRMTGAEKGD